MAKLKTKGHWKKVSSETAGNGGMAKNGKWGDCFAF